MAGTVFKVRGGLDDGRNFLVRVGCRATVGRTERANHAFSGDPLMSWTHFEVILSADSCVVRDLGSSNGTFVNGEQIEKVLVYEGDEIRAGQTTFVVSVDAETTDANPAQAARSHAGVMTVSPKTKMSFRMFSCHSTLQLAVGQQSTFDPAEIAGRLALLAPLYVILHGDDQVTLPDGVPHEFLSAEPTTDEPSASVLLGPADGDALALLATEAWGQDKLVCLFDHRDLSELAQQLRTFAHEKWRVETKELACFRPAAMVEFMANGAREDVESLTAGIDAVLSEVYHGDRWAVFVPRGSESSLLSVGLTTSEN